MYIYTPDAWVVLEMAFKEDKVQKVLAGWSGGYLDGDSWRLSSGISDIKETETEWIFTNHSGSIYYCRKNAREFNMMSSDIYNYYKEQEKNTEGLTISLVEFTRS